LLFTCYRSRTHNVDVEASLLLQQISTLYSTPGPGPFLCFLPSLHLFADLAGSASLVVACVDRVEFALVAELLHDSANTLVDFAFFILGRIGHEEASVQLLGDWGVLDGVLLACASGAMRKEGERGKRRRRWVRVSVEESRRGRGGGAQAGRGTRDRGEDN